MAETVGVDAASTSSRYGPAHACGPPSDPGPRPGRAPAAGRAGAGPLTTAQLDRLGELDETTLTVLLEVSGYRTPPPPSVGTLVDDTLADLAVALEPPGHRYGVEVAVGPVDGAARVLTAQRSLITLTMRVRRQITELEPSPLEPSVARASARRLGRAARWLLPKVAAASAGALAESLAPGSGVGFVVGKAVAKVAEDGIELAGSLAAARLPDGTDSTDSTAEPLLIPADPVLEHGAALVDQLTTLGRAADQRGPYAPADTGELDLARRSARHLRRLEDLLADRDRLGPEARHLLEVIADALGSYRPDTIPHRVGPAIQAADELAHRGDVGSI